MSTTLTLIERAALPTVAPNAYLFNDAVSDAFGWAKADGEFPASPAHEIDTVFLWESGCQLGDAWNCTMACLDTVQGPEMAWNSPNAMFTVQNCLLYPMLASAEAQSLLVQDPPGLLEKYGIDPSNFQDAGPIGNALTHFPVLESCVSEFCVDMAGINEASCSLWDSLLNSWTPIRNITIGPDYAPWIPPDVGRVRLEFAVS